MKKLILFIIHCISSILVFIMGILSALIILIEWKDVITDNDPIDIFYKIWKN